MNTAPAKFEADGGLAHFFDHSIELLAVLSADKLTWQRVNPALVHLLGAAEAELLDTPLLDWVAPEQRHAVQAELQANGEHLHVVHDLLCRDGSRQRISWQIIHDRQQDLLYGVGYHLPPEAPDRQHHDHGQTAPWICQSISQVRETEAALRQSEQRFREVLERSLDVAYRRDLRHDSYDYISPAAADVLGVMPDDLAAMTNQDLFETIHPDDRDVVEAAMSEAVDTGSSRIEFRFRRPDGQYRWIADYFSVQFDENDHPVQRSGIMRDIHEQKMFEQMLRENEERFRTLADNISQLAWMADANGCVFWFNRRWLDYTGASLQQMKGWRWRQLLHADYADCVVQKLDDCLRQGIEWEDTFPMCGKDNVHRWFLSRAIPIRDESGQILRWLGTHTDITERMRIEDELRLAHDELEKRVAERTTELELRANQLSRLTSELMFTEQRERRHLAQVLHDHLQQLLVGAKYGLEILARRAEAHHEGISQVSKLLDDAIHASRSLTVELSPPILHEAGLAAALEWIARFKKQKYDLDVEVKADTRASTDREDVRVLLFQATRELLFNVVKHAGVMKARVELAIHDQEHLRLTVADEGKGFDPLAAMIGMDQAEGGFGLFSIDERLALLGGRLEIDSEPRKGSRFTMIAPMSQKSSNTEDSSRRIKRPVQPNLPLPPLQGPASGAIRLMVVDDHAVMRQGLCSLLVDVDDIQVVGEAADGVDALKQAHILRPDIVLMDFSMPNLNGVDATRRLRRELPEIQIIGLSMYEEPDRAVAMLDAGAAAYLSKTGESNILIETIRNVFATAPRR